MLPLLDTDNAAPNYYTHSWVGIIVVLAVVLIIVVRMFFRRSFRRWKRN